MLTIEVVVGEFLGLDEDTELFAYFRRHYAHFFPNLLHVHRTTFSRQPANLWKAKELLWQEFLTCVPHDPTFAICDHLRLFALAGVSVRPSPSLPSLQRGGCFRQGHPPQADLLRLSGAPVRVCWPGVITCISVAPANAHELSVIPEIAERTSGLIVGDRNYHSPKISQELASIGMELLAPYSSNKRDPTPKKSAFLSRLRYRIDTVFSQLTERYFRKEGVGARPLASGKQTAAQRLRKVLSHTVAFLLNHQMGNPPLQLSKLLI